MRQSTFVARYSKKFDNFNDELIRSIRQRERMEYFIDVIFKELQKQIPKDLKYLGYRYADTTKSLSAVNAGEAMKGFESTENKSMSITETFARLAIFSFKLNGIDSRINKHVVRFIDVPIYIPESTDENSHYLIHGNMYSVPIQISDSLTYTNKSQCVIIKFLTRAVKTTKSRKMIQDVNHTKYVTNGFYVFISSKQIPALLFYFSEFGFSGTMKYFGADKFIKFWDAPVMDQNLVCFQIGKIFMTVDTTVFATNSLIKQFVAMILDCAKSTMDQSDVENVTRWQMILGGYISESNQLIKGQGLVKTFKLAFDNITQQMIDKLGAYGESKSSTFALIRYIFLNFTSLSMRNESLVNKRLKLGEYLTNPITQRVWRSLYRFLGTNERNRDIKRLMDILKIPPSIIINAISGRNTSGVDLNIDISKYSSSVNDDAISNTVCQYTFGGVGSSVSKSGKLTGSKSRGIHPSYVGRIDITTSSNSRPGLSGILVPSCQIDLNSLTFTGITSI